MHDHVQSKEWAVERNRTKEAILVEIGDRIQIESENVGSPPRSGVVTSIHEHLLGIRWDDGSESSFMPSAGSLRVLGRAEEAEADRQE